jgi:dihydroorotate dehydrogenase electron transfer subunit
MIKFAPVATRVVRRRHLTDDYYSLTFSPVPGIKRARPGQFVHLRLPECQVYFRRAMSIAAIDVERSEMEIIFKIFGRGTKILSGFRKGQALDMLGPLGKPFTKPKKTETPLMVGGGIGFPPLLYLAADLVQKGYDPARIQFFYGGRSKKDILERTRIRKLGVTLHVVTEDGSLGRKGLVTEAVEEYLDTHPDGHPRIYSCGPEGMLKAVDDLGVRRRVPGEVSLEAPMPCGYGVCLGCVVPLRKGGHARVCQEGPVFQIGEVVL